jgi:hypothetical protein
MGVGDRVLVGIPPAIAQIQASHESYVAVDKTEFLVMSPVQDGILVHTVHSLDGIARKLGKVGSSHLHALDRRHEGRSQDVTVGEMIRMAKDGNVRVELLERVLCVSRRNCDWRIDQWIGFF